jgi:hypothetical protein
MAIAATRTNNSAASVANRELQAVLRDEALDKREAQLDEREAALNKRVTEFRQALAG